MYFRFRQMMGRIAGFLPLSCPLREGHFSGFFQIGSLNPPASARALVAAFPHSFGDFMAIWKIAEIAR